MAGTNEWIVEENMKRRRTGREGEQEARRNGEEDWGWKYGK